ncbi:putative brct domain-containing protein [Phaeomoniella chlamydospora]|uniref:Putative brct domain-containing protein n=1 Tax=Phaeomoniella chlamydospora TaxID=158046 RepID=A0A0G2GC78_PHACM|nr:putative brct domain-containing protein [Phaeomoniella chlamydospora]
MPHQASLPKAPQPTRTLFDPFNSSATGHQRAENRLSGSTSWRESRSHKLSHQFRDATGGGGTEHLADLVGAGSENFGVDGRKENGDWETGAQGLREPGCQDVRGLLGGPQKAKDSGKTETEHNEHGSISLTSDYGASKAPAPIEPKNSKRLIFSGLTFYLNGSTAPLVGDHKLKHLLAQYGGHVAIALGRRTVTHVILGETKHHSGTAKGLAASKIQKEMTRVGGKGVKYVTANWALESIKAGRRLPEARYSALNLNSKGSKGVYGMFQKDKSNKSSSSEAISTDRNPREAPT